MISKEYDLIIIGAGIIGLFTAHMASEKFPGAKILVVDQNFKSTGASFYSIALDIPYGHNEIVQELSQASRDYYKQFEEFSNYKRKQVPLVGITKEDNFRTLLGKFNSDVNLCGDKYNYEVSISEEEVIFSGLDARQTISYEYVDSLIEKIKLNNSIEILQGLKINQVHRNKNGYTVSTSRGTALNTRKVINATGPWAINGLNKEDVKELGIRTKKIVSYHIPITFETGYYLFDHDAFVTSRMDVPDQSIFSYRCNEYDVSPVIGDVNINTANISNAFELFDTYFPNQLDFEQFSTLGGRCFCDAYADKPIVSEISSGHIIAGAGSGSGFRLAPGIAQKAISLLNL